MAFSFRVGTNWCHDFPKLARESGFHFNMHKSKVRVDWNRISSIDVERVIRERDFWIVDENVNNVIDYSLESEYDVKILDPNFVKLFRLAQLAVEYLLYCKQYLDHSVVILKDELKLKIEENNKLKKQIAESEETITRLKEKTRDRSRLIETRNTDSTGEIHKCPHCPKTFVSAIFVTAHIARRHHYLSGLESSFSPVHDTYRAETEKLSNEIKALKERLNQTEKVIRSESKVDRTKLYSERRLSGPETESSKSDLEKTDDHAKYKSYHEDISNLKNMLFEEIKNLRQRSMYDHTSESSVQTLINQQEKEFQKLRNQLLQRLTPDIESMQSKLQVQEDYWKSKLEHLESEHHKDNERLLGELKLTQELSDRVKHDYESKINDLEQHTLKQSSILLEQSKQLKQLSERLSNSQSEFVSKGEVNIPTNQITRLSLNYNELQERNLQRPTAVTQVTVEDENSVSSTDSTRKVTLVTHQNKPKKGKAPLRKLAERDTAVPKKVKQVKPIKNVSQDSDSGNGEAQRTANAKKARTHHSFIKPLPKNEYISMIAVRNANSKNEDKIKVQSLINISPNEAHTGDSSDTPSESLTISSQSEYESESESMSVVKNEVPHNDMLDTVTLPKHKIIKKMPTDRRIVQAELQETMQQKLRDLGIDPEWHGIPNKTFKEKMDIIKHHSKITAKKFPKYNQIKLKIIEEIRNKLGNKNLTKMDNKSNVKVKAINRFVNQRDTNGFTSKLESEAMAGPQQKRKGKSNSYKIDSADSTPKSTGSISSSNNESKQKPVNNHDESINISTDIYQTFVNRVESDKTVPAADRAQLRLTSTPVAKQPFLVKPAPRRDRTTIKSHEDIVQSFLNSPRSNKSVLKSASGSTSSLIKKRVNFDLKDEEVEEIKITSDTEQKSDDAECVVKYMDMRSNLELQEKPVGATNIILKTSQSNKIAEISRKIEEQLSITRHQPVGSVETIFLANQSGESLKHDHRVEQLNTPNTDSLPQSPLSSTRSHNNALPLPAPRNIPENTSDIVSYDTDDFDLNSDIDEILKTE